MSTEWFKSFHKFPESVTGRSSMVKRWTILLLLLSAAICAQANQSEALPSPPSFVHKVNEPIVYFTLAEHSPSASDKPILERTLRCAAEGNPAPDYQWKKEGQLLDLDSIQDRVIVGPDDGKLFFKSFLAEDEGNYTCEANNSLGVALSESIRLEHAWIKYFGEATPEKVVVELGDPYVRKCTPPESNPEPRVYWLVTGDQSHFESLDADHISMADDGTLFIHSVKETDQKKDDLYYTCAAENTVLKDYKFGKQFQISVNADNRRFLYRNPKPPTELYSGQSAPIALQGQPHKLSCFFGGIRAGVPKWYHNGTLITPDNSTFTVKGKQTLTFKASMDKAGEYACKFDGYPGSNRVFTVNVEAAPYWPEGPPTNTQAEKGETVSFDCGAGGVPAPSTMFYKNGSPLVESQEAETRGSKLILRNVTEDSIAVYQCKVENKHGILWKNFYLNIVAPVAELPASPEEEETTNATVRGDPVTEVPSPVAPYWLEGPPMNITAEKDETVSFDCGASGVPTPSTIFYKNGSQLVESQEAEIRGSKLILHNVTEESAAVYQCKIENEHGILQAEFNLNIVAPNVSMVELPVLSEEEEIMNATVRSDPVTTELPPSTKNSTKKEGRVNGPIRTERVTQAGDPSLVAVIIFTIIAIAMIIALIIIYATRKGGKYEVAGMELERGLERDNLL